jgi:hypothetical protein
MTRPHRLAAARPSRPYSAPASLRAGADADARLNDQHHRQAMLTAKGVVPQKVTQQRAIGSNQEPPEGFRLTPTNPPHYNAGINL